jgi:hypothetical protein
MNPKGLLVNTSLLKVAAPSLCPDVLTTDDVLLSREQQ